MDSGRSNEGVWCISEANHLNYELNNTIETLKTNVSISLKTNEKQIQKLWIDIWYIVKFPDTHAHTHILANIYI